MAEVRRPAAAEGHSSSSWRKAFVVCLKWKLLSEGVRLFWPGRQNEMMTHRKACIQVLGSLVPIEGEGVVLPIHRTVRGLQLVLRILKFVHNEYIRTITI